MKHLCVYFLAFFSPLALALPTIDGNIHKLKRFESCNAQESARIKIRFPWEVSIINKNTNEDFFCTGSIISKQWIVTAAHCFGNVDGPLEVIANSNQSFQVEHYEKHENFNPYLYDDDIALIKLNDPIIVQEHVETIEMNQQALANGTNVRTSGWINSCGDVQENLEGKFSRFTMVDNNYCDGVYGDLLPSAGCAVVANHNAESGLCHRDAGDSLVWYRDEKPVLAGLVSFGSTKGCKQGMITVYSKIEFYRDWIKEKTNV